MPIRAKGSTPHCNSVSIILWSRALENPAFAELIATAKAVVALMSIATMIYFLIDKKKRG